MPNEKSSSSVSSNRFFCASVKHAVGELLGLGGAERRQVEGLQLAVHADLRRRLRRQVQVGPFVVDERLQQFR